MPTLRRSIKIATSNSLANRQRTASDPAAFLPFAPSNDRFTQPFHPSLDHLEKIFDQHCYILGGYGTRVKAATWHIERVAMKTMKTEAASEPPSCRSVFLRCDGEDLD